MISIATKHPVEYGSTMSMTDCAVVTDEEEEEDMLMLDGCWLVALRGLCVRFKWAIMSVRDGLLFETTGVECVDLSTHAKMKNDKARATTNIRRRAAAGEIPYLP